MQINVSFDSQTLQNAPAGYFTAINYVVNLFDTTFTNNVTVNIEADWGEYFGGVAGGIPSGDNAINIGNFTLNTVPTGVVYTTAQARALNIGSYIQAYPSNLDGWVGFQAYSNWSFAQALPNA